jgi:hypothetical protein
VSLLLLVSVLGIIYLTCHEKKMKKERELLLEREQQVRMLAGADLE